MALCKWRDRFRIISLKISYLLLSWKSLVLASNRALKEHLKLLMILIRESDEIDNYLDESRAIILYLTFCYKQGENQRRR